MELTPHIQALSALGAIVMLQMGCFWVKQLALKALG